jgi:hypothetical protein
MNAWAATAPDKGIRLTLSVITEPAGYADALAMALEADPAVAMNLSALLAEGIARSIQFLEDAPCKVLIADLAPEINLCCPTTKQLRSCSQSSSSRR